MTTETTGTAVAELSVEEPVKEVEAPAAPTTTAAVPATPTAEGPADEAKVNEVAPVENPPVKMKEIAAAAAPTATVAIPAKKEEVPAALAAPAPAAPLTAAQTSELKALMDFYFGAANWRRDKFLQGEAAKDPEGYVPLTVLLTFNKLKKLTTDSAIVVKALEQAPHSTLLTLNADKTAVKRTVASIPATGAEGGDAASDDSDKRTLFVDGIPKVPTDGAAEVTVDDIVSIFKALGPVDFVRLSRDKTSKKLTGAAFVEFPTVADAQKALAVEWKTHPVASLGGKTNVILRVRQYERDYKSKLSSGGAGAAVGQKRRAQEVEEGGEGGEGGRKRQKRCVISICLKTSRRSWPRLCLAM